MSDCQRCKQDESYGCGCTSQEIAKWQADRLAAAEKLAEALGMCREDLLGRAETDRDGQKVVAVGFTVWRTINDALAAWEASK